MGSGTGLSEALEVVGDGFQHSFLGEAEELGFDDERFNLMGEQVAARTLGRAGRSGNDCANAGLGFEELFGK